MKPKFWRFLYICVTLSMLVSMLSPTGLAGAQTPLPPGEPTVLPSPGGQGARPDPMSKLDSTLRAAAEKGGNELLTVYILAKPGVKLHGVANVSEVRPFMDDKLVVATIKPSMLVKLASNPNVISAEVFHAIEAPIPATPKEDLAQPTRESIREMRDKAAAQKAAGPQSATPQELGKGMPGGASSITPSGQVSPTDWNGSDLIGAPNAWANGFTGTGANIAIIDSGVDFGHPDLDGRQATYTGGPYAGWPIALDPRSMRNYLYNGWTSTDNYNNWWDRSWYADVYNVMHTTAGNEATFDFNAATYTIDTTIVALSQSGDIRWGIHPDEQLADFVYNWVPFILLDTTTAGVYDTVIADLNFDYWFDGYDDVANKADPVLTQDLGSYLYADTAVAAGTQYVPNWWTSVGLPPTWWIPWNVSPGEVLPAGSWIAALDHNSIAGANDGADGMADVSGGMIYYIADGQLPVPGMDYLYPESGIPLNGQLVAFMIGSYWAGGGEHGTLCASAAVAGGEITGYFGATGEWVQYDPADFTGFTFPPSNPPAGMMTWLKGAEGTVQGPAPDARIIAIGDNYSVVNGMQGFYDAYTFLAYGVDGAPNSGDEFVQVASMSYGDGSVHNDGWDWESRLISYYNQTYLPNTTFTASSGNGGHGFGTINSPQGNTTVSVGASTQYGASDVFGGGLAASQINDGEVQPFSGRGPDALGRPDPDVVATGAWGAGDVPLNLAPIYGFVYGGWYVQDGNNAWYEWGGTSRAAPEAAGVLALIYQAYKDKNGAFPTFETARQILMSGSDDLSHDVLMQGAGRVNADQATSVAGGVDGVYVSPSLLAAGEYQGTHFESFANVLFPGDTWAQTFTVHNTGAASKTVIVGDEILLEDSALNYNVVVKPYTGMEDPTYPNAYFYYANYFVNGATPIPVPAGADLMQVQLLVPFELQDFAYTDPDPWSVGYTADQRWSLTVYDWTDRNADDDLWDDVNADGIVNPQAGTDTLDIAYIGPTQKTEINRFGYSYLYGNQQEVTVRLGDRTDIDNIVLGIVHRNDNDTRPGWGAAEYSANPLQVKVTFYKKADWPLVSESPASLSVAAGGSGTFDATFTIPAAQAPGLYEGAIRVDDGTHTSIVPVTVNVAVPNDDLLFNLGGTAAAGTPYDNGRMNGGWTWYSVYEEGDWRYYYYDANTGFDQQYLYVNNQWGTHHTNMPAFNETLVWGPNPGDQFSLKEPAKYGPYGMQFAGGTPYANTFPWWSWWGDPREGFWWQNGDGTPLPESRAWATLWDGLNQVQFRNILLSGTEFGEDFASTAGVFGVDAPETGLTINTDQSSGSFTLDAVSPVDGLVAYASGFGEEQWFRNQNVPQGKHTDFPPADLMSGWVHTFTATNLSAIQISTFGLGSDIDLYLLYDANGDGVFNFYDNREYLADSTWGGSNEYIWYSGGVGIPFVADGTYAVVMYGYDIQPGDQFDLRLVTYGGDKLNVAGANAGNNYVLGATPGLTQNLTVNWDVPGSGVWWGFIWFGMPWEEEPTNWSQVPGIFVPVTINASGVVPSVTKTVDRESVCQTTTAGAHEILTYNITVSNGGNENAWIKVADLLPAGLSYVRSSREPTVNDGTTSYYARWWNDVGEFGYIWPDGNGYLRLNRSMGPSTSGKLYIEYRVKVDAGFVGPITNKADVTMDFGGFHQFLSDTALTDVNYCVYAPLIVK